MAEYITEIRISKSVEAKIMLKHHVSGFQVRQALENRTDIQTAWVYTPKYGKRLEVVGKINERTLVIAYLYEVNYQFGIWNLATAWIIKRGAK